MDSLTLNGIPRALARDGWWLDDDTQPPARPGETRSGLPRWTSLPILILAADLLFWKVGNGVNIALFAGVIFALATASVPRRALIWPALIVATGALPVVEMVQPLSLAFLLAATMLALVMAHHSGTSLATLAFSGAARLIRLPALWLRSMMPRVLWSALTEAEVAPKVRSLPGAMPALIRNWAFPLGGAMVFAALMIDANPIFSRALTTSFDLTELTLRVLFWGGIAVLTAPFLSAPPLVTAAPALPAMRLPGLGINAGSTLRALVLFNAVIGLQSLSDLTILVGGAELPEGMSYAEYAHRGAYPLLATALLAGAFALAARPFLNEHRALKPLMLLWIAQNVALCLSALLRLDLYIDSYGLTYLRVYALIWMGLTAAVLALIGWQALAGRSNRWLVLRGAGLGAATLYACCFVNFAQMIAAQNLTRDEPDLSYVCSLGDYAFGPVEAFRTEHMRTCWRQVQKPAMDHWQEWGFRKARVHAYLAPTQGEARP